MLINKMAHMNPTDPTLQKALCDSHEFEKVELVLEDSEVESEALEVVRVALIRLTGQRKIDETPAALHEVMQQFGDEKLAAATRVKDWAEAAGFPLPATFRDGLDVLSGILNLTNPNHRVKAIHGHVEDLKRGVEAINLLSAFHEKWRAAFHEAKQLAGQIRAIEHLLPADGDVRRFLDEYEAAFAAARFAEPEVWKSVQSARAAASLELETFLESRRNEAHQIVEQALDRLPDDLREAFLAEDLAKEMAAPLDAFIVALELEKEPARVASLPDRARNLVRQLGEAIRAEVERRAARPTETPPDALRPPREVRRVRISDVATVRRVRNEAEWADLAKKIDEHVRALLRDYDVEID